MPTFQAVRTLLTRFASIGLTILFMAAFAARVAAQVGGDAGFQSATPEDLAAGQERLPATPFVFAAYATVWVVVVFYVLTLWRRIGKAEREIRLVAARLEELDR